MTEAPRRPARRSRVAALGIGVATMAGLVGNMQLRDGAEPTPDPAPSPIGQTHRAAVAADRASAHSRAAAAPRPIVLTPRTVVRSVSVTAPAYSGGSTGSTSTAPAPAAAPAATTGGSG